MHAVAKNPSNLNRKMSAGSCNKTSLVRKPWRQIAWLTAAVAIGTSLGGSALADTVFRFNTWLPRKHPHMVRVFQPLAKQFEKLTDGRVRIEFTAASLGPPQRQFEMIRTGIADLAFSNHGLNPGQFPMADIVRLPLLGDNAEALSVAYWRTHQKYLAKANEHAGLMLIALSTHNPGGIFNSKRPIRSAADIAGLKLIVTGGEARIVKALGGTAVLAPPPKFYELISRGVADGGFFDISAPASFKLERFLPHHTTFPGGLYNKSFPVVMNSKKWAAVSESDRQKLQPLLGEALSRRVGRIWVARAKRATSRFSSQGITNVVADAAFVADIRKKFAPMEAQWIQRAKSKGIDGAAALKMLREEAAKLGAQLR